MAQGQEPDTKSVDVDAEKPGVNHEEIVVVAADKELTAWQCMRANPKIVMWALYANSTTIPHVSSGVPLSD